MDKVYRDCSVRLFIGLFINLIMLKPVLEILGTCDVSWTNGLEFQLAFVGGATAVVTLVLIARVFWKGVSWQQVAASLLVPVPAILIFDAFRYWWTE